jgi:hypothetical protein
LGLWEDNLWEKRVRKDIDYMKKIILRIVRLGRGGYGEGFGVWVIFCGNVSRYWLRRGG